MRTGLRQYQRQQHIESLLATERETAALLGQLEAKLPAGVYGQVVARLDGKDFAQQFDYALKLANRLQAMAEIVTEAERILLVGDNLVTIQGQGQTYGAVPANWRIMAHLALTAGWCQVGRGLLEKRRAGSATNTPALEAPEGTQTQTQDTTDQAPRQVEIVAVYEADGAGGLARIHDDGKLAEYKADGQAADPPAGTLKDLYHWLEAHGYTPAGFQWLDRGPGNRCRRQVYVLGGVYRDWHAAAVVYDGPGSDGLEPATETEAAAVAEAGRRYRERKLVFCLEAEARLRWQNRGQVRACPLLTQKGKVR